MSKLSCIHKKEQGFRGINALKAFTVFWTVAIASIIPLTGQVCVDSYHEDGTRYVCSVQEVMYDNYFHTAHFAVEATTDPSGLVMFSLKVTYDEGMLDISHGDSLTLVLRGGDRIYLATDRDVTRSDIVKRHFKSQNIYYVTCHYRMREHDVQRITRNKVTKISVQTDKFDFDRKLDKFQERFRRQFTAVYRYLMESSKR